MPILSVSERKCCDSMSILDCSVVVIVTVASGCAERVLLSAGMVGAACVDMTTVNSTLCKLTSF